jgi:hypothetical protein
MEFYEMHDGVIGHSMANFFLRSSPKRGKVKISLHVDCHEVNMYGGTDTVAEFGAAVIGWVTNWGTKMLQFKFFLHAIFFLVFSFHHSPKFVFCVISSFPAQIIEEKEEEGGGGEEEEVKGRNKE